ncbi:MAG: Asp-tRNA(Asn)/Glu-tRNA(Gln) amidotransferase subunit GatC [Armatimonadetes bacterium]|nr:Asp-tRNA(Asn)/Glu-tRNA(Gln) amidotransferase subunit GatC [Akkermansiaceae bacterium]
MPNTRIDVRYVAKLARLDLSSEEVATFQIQLESILSHVESLSAAYLPDDLKGDQSLLLGSMRDDLPGESLALDLVLHNAPDQSQSQIKVPKVVADA